MKIFFKIILGIVAVLSLYFLLKPKPVEKIIIDKNYSDYKIYTKKAFEYCKKKNLNESYFFLVDLSVHSGKKRFYVCDFTKEKITDRYMVSHGCGSMFLLFWSKDCTKENAEISNEVNSRCSSVGKYIIGKKGVSRWGIKVNYQLYGMDKTNNNASKRAIVLHSWNAINDFEVYPDGVAEGYGCPAVSNHSMKEIIKKIDASSKKTLLWIIK
ncbi:MAG: murein L,D-transpeptidase catalytic domain family protein [Sphingobacteriales bacterium]|nr:murein L,D-transpeptidase catalytic domain family protein [Sphingobacteriales bacterium]